MPPAPDITLPVFGDALPLAGGERPERADAAENRRKVLAAAERLFAAGSPDCVTMDAVAAEAGVGKGTLFRRFGDRAGLVRALVSETEARLQDDMIRGPAPLGPGAPPLERLLAFGRAYIEFLDRHGDLLRLAEGSFDSHLGSSPYAFYRTHIALLLREGGLGERSDFLADVILAPLAATMFAYLRGTRQLSCAELADAHADLCTRLLDSAG
jgi:AcrR family transcriptional regulator